MDLDLLSGKLDVPFVWPDSRRLAGCAGPTPDLDSIFSESRLLLGVVHGLTGGGVARLGALLRAKPAASSNGNGNGHSPADKGVKKVQLVVALYPTCPTTTEALTGLFQLQQAHPQLQVRLTTCDLLAGPQSVLACYKGADALPVVMVGSAAGFEDLADDPAHLTLAFTPEPTLAAEWAKWFNVRWLKAAPLTQERTAIPHLVLPEGTMEAAKRWAAYQQLCEQAQSQAEAVVITVDPVSGEVSAQAADGTAVITVSTENRLPKLTPVYRKLAQLLDKGHLVSVDKTTRLRPLEVSVRPQWFGLETLKQIGSVRRQVSYHISALTEDELKQLENRRKKTSELLDLFSFSIADGQRWMPTPAEDLFRQENSRINTEAREILSELVAGDLAKFLAARREAVRRDANRMYRDLFPDRTLPADALDEIMGEMKKRFEQAQQRSFLPQLSFTRVSLPQPQDAGWKSQLGSALHLLLSIVRYPRKACLNGSYFARGMTVKPPQILAAMNLLDDPFIALFEKSEARATAEAQLERIEAIEASEATGEEKCERLLAIVGQASVLGSDQSGR